MEQEGSWNDSQFENEIGVPPVFVEQVEVGHQSVENNFKFRYQN